MNRISWGEEVPGGLRKAVTFKTDPFGAISDTLPDVVLCRVTLKSHVLLNAQGRALDGDLLGGLVTTGNSAPGGDFESWFGLRICDGE